MALTNAERQARHRARVKDALRNAGKSEPLRNDLLQKMNDAFEEAHRSAMLRVVEWSDQRWGVPDEDDPWFGPRNAIIRTPGFRQRTDEEWIRSATELGEKLGDYLALQLLHDAVAEKVSAQKAAAEK